MNLKIKKKEQGPVLAQKGSGPINPNVPDPGSPLCVYKCGF